MTPKELMQQRYNAFVNEDWEFIANTSTHQSVAELSNSPKIEWLKLEVIDDYDNFVEFKAYYKLGNSIELLHEKSTFILEGNSWKYDSGELFNTAIQRNEECPCGSGKKYKKCCMKN